MSESYFGNQGRELWNPCLEHEVSSWVSSFCLSRRLRTRITRMNGITPTIVIKIIKPIICQRQNALWCFRFNLGQRSEKGISIKSKIYRRILVYKNSCLSIKGCASFYFWHQKVQRFSYYIFFYLIPHLLLLCSPIKYISLQFFLFSMRKRWTGLRNCIIECFY